MFSMNGLVLSHLQNSRATLVRKIFPVAQSFVMPVLATMCHSCSFCYWKNVFAAYFRDSSSNCGWLHLNQLSCLISLYQVKVGSLGTAVSSYPQFLFLWFRLPAVSCGLETWSCCLPVRRSMAAWCSMPVPTSFPSLLLISRHFIISGRVSTVQWDILRKRDHFHMSLLQYIVIIVLFYYYCC